MARRRKNQEADTAELIVKGIFGLLMLIALGTGGIVGFGDRLLALIQLVIAAAVFIGICIAAFFVIRHFQRNRIATGTGIGATDLQPTIINVTPRSTAVSQPPASAKPVKSPDTGQQAEWTLETIMRALGEIDWYQFEKFCAALLRAEGFTVERKGGAQPDGGVDLIASNNSIHMLVQCKHWRTWTVQEKTIRELLGSMTHFGASQGSLYTLKGWTKPSEAFAREHNILLCDQDDLARRALARLQTSELTSLLSAPEHHCPKCESPMVWRTGNFDPFWGCSTYPRCRGKLNHTGAK